MYVGSEEIAISVGNEGVRWMSRVTKLDRIKNDIIRVIAKVGEISKKCMKVV